VGIDTRDDAGVYQLDANTALVQTMDFFAPLVDDPFAFGQIAAANALSDIYAMNARPLTTLNLVGFPDNELPMELLSEILAGVADRVSLAGAVNLGGHSVRDSEIKIGLAVTGVAAPSEIIRNVGAREGDILVMTKPLGTGYVTTAHKRGSCTEETLLTAIASMIQLNVVARDAVRAVGGVSAMTDITGFGLAVHASEMVESTELAIRFHVSQLPVFPGVLELIESGVRNRANASNREYLTGHYREDFQKRDPDSERLRSRQCELLFDPQTSGGMLIAVDPKRADALLRELLDRGATCAQTVGVLQRRSADSGDWVTASD
jgi:selenide,water dikinase